MVDIKLIHKILLEKYEKYENHVEFKITKKNCKIVKIQPKLESYSR